MRTPTSLTSSRRSLYRCDRCPYANVRRDHLLTHLKFHMLKSTLACPYCDYSVSKQHHLAQHIKVHFCPLPELSNWLTENGQLDRVKQSKDPDISEAIYVAQLYKRDELKDDGKEESMCNGDGGNNPDCDQSVKLNESAITIDNNKTPVKDTNSVMARRSPESDTDNEISFKDSSMVITPTTGNGGQNDAPSEQGKFNANTVKELLFVGYQFSWFM